MCGIVGAAGSLALTDEPIFKCLLLLDYFRGQDSTGVATVDDKKRVSTLKVADDPIILMKHQDFDLTVNGACDNIWIGHNRASTIGASTRANAHPFTANHITGVHNGTLDKEPFNQLAARLEEGYGTDSETIFAHIAKYGVDDTIPRLGGAWTLVWYDAKEDTLNMIRNDQRPLYLAEIVSNTRRRLLWASDYKMLSAAIEMADMSDDLERDDEGYAFFPMQIDTLHTWNRLDLVEGRMEARKRPLHGKPKFVEVARPAGFVAGVPVEPVKDKIETALVEFNNDPPGTVFGGALTLAQWESLAADGCSYCSAPVELDDEGLMLFVDEAVILCPSCSGLNETTISDNYASVLEKIL